MAGLILVALAVRVPGLGATNLWLDEANSWSLAKYSLPALLANIRSSPGSPLYFVLLEFWVRAFGDSERALRSLSLLTSLALIPVTYSLGTRALSRRAALLGTTLLALSPMQLYYAQEARVYMMVTLFTTAAVAAYVVWRQAVCGTASDASAHDASPPTARPGVALAGYVLFATLAIYTLNLVAFALLAINIDAVLAGVRLLRSRRDTFGTVTSRSPAYQGGALHSATAGRGLWQTASTWIVAQIVIGVACLPLVLAVDVRSAVSSQAWRGALGPAGALRALLDFFASTIHGGYLYPWDLYHAIADNWGAGAILERVVVYPLTLLAVLTALSYPPRSARTGAARVLYLVLGVSLLAGAAISVRHELSLHRYFLFTTPCLYLLIGAGLARMAGWLRGAALTVLLATMVIGQVTYRQVHSRDSDYRPVARRLAEQRRPSDEILVQPPEMTLPLSYYLRGPGNPLRTIPAGTPLRGALVPAPDTRTWLVLDYRSGSFSAAADSLARLLPGHVRSDVLENPGGAGVRIIEIDSAAPAHP